jgi:glycosyltransferase involved in cell wall biosynthesis
LHAGVKHLLWFNLATDADDPILGFTTSWIRAAARRVGRVDVVTMRRGRFEVPPNVSVRSVGKERAYSEVRRAFEFYRILSSLTRERQYDACFVHMIPVFAAMAWPLLARQRVPITLWYTHRAASAVLRLAARASTQVVTASTNSFPLQHPRLIVTGHGTDTDLFRPLADRPNNRDGFTLLVAGRISPIKRLEMVLEGVHRFVMRTPHPDIRIRFVGPALDPAYAAGLSRAAVSMDLSRRVEFAGPVPYMQMPEIYRHADALVSVTGQGSFDKAPLEAMSCGIPVLSSDETLGRDLGEHGGTILPAGDPDTLASSLAVLTAETSDRRRRRGELLRTLVTERHGLERLMDRLLGAMTPAPHNPQ